MQTLTLQKDPFDILRDRVWVALSCDGLGRIGELAILHGMVAMLGELGIVDRPKEQRLMGLLNELLRLE